MIKLIVLLVSVGYILLLAFIFWQTNLFFAALFAVVVIMLLAVVCEVAMRGTSDD